MEGHRYSDEPDSRWYPDRFGADADRPSAEPPRIPDQRYPYGSGADLLEPYGGAHSYPADRDDADTGVRSAHDALRFPLRPDDPARPVSAGSPQPGPSSAFGDAAGGGRAGSSGGTGLGDLDFRSSRAGDPASGGRAPDALGFGGSVPAPGGLSGADAGRGGPGGSIDIDLGRATASQTRLSRSGVDQAGQPGSDTGTQALGGPGHADPAAAPTGPLAPAEGYRPASPAPALTGGFRPTSPAPAVAFGPASAAPAGAFGPVSAAPAGDFSPVSAAPAGPAGPAPAGAFGPVGGGLAGPASPGAAAEPTGLLPPVQQPASPGIGDSRTPAPDGVYRSRRPALAIMLIAGVAVLAIPAVRLFVEAAFADVPTAREIVPACLLLSGLPLTGLGLYALAGGGRTVDRASWLRPPVGYLTVGLALLAAAALAVG